MISIIAAIDQNSAIGLRNRLLCHLPNDLKYFKRITSGHPVIMGRCTYESLPVKPLPGRHNIVISRSLDTSLPDGCTLARSVDDALKLCGDAQKCFVIGGSQIYSQMLPVAQKLYITLIHHSFEADAWFPEISVSEWRLQSSEWHAPDEKHPYSYSFEVYTRIDKT